MTQSSASNPFSSDQIQKNFLERERKEKNPLTPFYHVHDNVTTSLEMRTHGLERHLVTNHYVCEKHDQRLSNQVSPNT